MSKLSINKDSICVVCSDNTLKSVKYKNLNMDAGMVLTKSSSKLNNKDVYCWLFKEPVTRYNNKHASAVMKREVIGNCILFSPDGLTHDEIQLTLQPAKPSWASMAKNLAPKLPLSEHLLDKKQQEQEERMRDKMYEIARNTKKPAYDPKYLISEPEAEEYQDDYPYEDEEDDYEIDYESD